MKSFSQFISEELSRTEIGIIERFADKLFAAVNVDVDLSGKHFRDRVNDPRNGEDITVVEMMALFKKVFQKHGAKIGGMNAGVEAVITDFNSHINLPFMLKYDKKNDEIDLIAKTVMRKRGFKTSTARLGVQ
jgi:hypothetical protein|tara:strand:+ start:667 stop:1062 length:396 start_codon:yes stop_codon:yes gene_type:complete